MATTFADIYLPSVSSEGKTWRIGYYKPDRRPGVVVATEGDSEVTSDGIRIFKCILFEARRFRRELPGRATKRAMAQTLAALLTEMRDAGTIPPERADALILKAGAI
jgi:hypothetical protein